MIEFVLPMVASIIQGALGHGLATNKAANERNEQIRMARMRREELQPIIDKLQQARDYFDMEEQLARDFSRASDQFAAESMGSGMTGAGAGGLDARRGDLLGSMIASLAQAKSQDDMQRTAMLAEILGDPSLQVGSLTEGDVVGQTLLAGLLGAATGGATQLSSFLGSKEGVNILKGLGGGGEQVLDIDSWARRYNEGDGGITSRALPPIPNVYTPGSYPYGQPGGGRANYYGGPLGSTPRSW